MSYTLGKSDSFMNLLTRLYTTPDYVEILNKVKQRMRPVHSRSNAMFDDIEAEIVCLLLMHANPSLVYEFSPCGGWSTLYMLNTLDLMNSPTGRIVSFDIQDRCTKNIGSFDSLARRWEFKLGNVENEYKTFTSDIDYLFIDSDHSAAFTQKYIDELLTPLLAQLRAANKKIIVSVHDVFHTPKPSEEGELVIQFLKTHGIEYFSPKHSDHAATINALRTSNKVDTSAIHSYVSNPCIFFELG
jgi:predicted O-methyltransferase YrrM